MNRRRVASIGAALVLGAGAVAGFVALGRSTEDPLEEALVGQGPTLLLADEALGVIEAEGTRWVRPEAVSGAVEALEGGDPSALVEAMRSEGIAALVVGAQLSEVARGGADEEQPEGARVLQRLRAFDHVEGFSGVLLSPRGALYRIAEPVDAGDDPDLLAMLARAILQGRRPPPPSTFPPELRRLGNVEVMVMLRQHGQARLWRSARDSSIAKALVTAATIARQRWDERESAMGGPLERQLPRMDVEVSLLDEDGTLASTRPDFVERVFGPEHGVAFENRGARRAWRYLLPEATARKGEGSAVAAYGELFRENDLPEDSFSRPDLRFYRLVVRRLGRSPATSASVPDLGPLPDPGSAASPEGRLAPAPAGSGSAPE